MMGKLKFYEELWVMVVLGLIEMLEIFGFGVKKIKVFNEEFGIDMVDVLVVVCVDGWVVVLKGFGEKL